MNHLEFINGLLDHACGIMSVEEVKKNGGYQKYHLSLHCREYTVEAKPIYLGETHTYDIKSLTKE